MKLISAIICSTAAVGSSFALPALASATDVHCGAEHGVDVTVIDGRAGCRATADPEGQARSAGFDGVGYARATAGATALGVGAAGGIGAAEGAGGIPVALGFGPDALALTSITDPDAADGRTIAVSIAFEGSRAQVSSEERTVVCLGSAAFAWNAATGASCLATPFGRWAASH
ncbi:hypothetical protein APR12_003993 [Nocardia amikacinitolerans]|uniref:DUF6764 family protein n=1 Tax=Nocardia amikacinitolerans TaxID=756689 RepID=UPI00082C3D29|nr:DUF6764 family protein [Nocardia amikacinitolerans]MCP2318638.1 hypothetical protein [Nocardia amikacinitolerans]